MKYFYSLILLFYSHCVFSASLPSNYIDTRNSKIQIDEFVRLNPQEYKKITGKKLSLKEVIALKITQKRIKKIISQGGSIDRVNLGNSSKEFKWHWGGFLLGFFLPGLGFIITFFIKDEHRRNRIFSALIGFTLILGFIGIILFLKAITGGL